MIPRLWLDMAKYQARRRNLLTGNWDPDNWDTSHIIYDAIQDQAEGVIIRLGDGLNLDPCFERFREAFERRGMLWAVYHLHRPNVSPEAQVAFILHHLPALPPAGVWADLEVDAGYTGLAYFARTNPYLLELDEAYHRLTGVYSGAWFLDPLLPRDIQRAWRDRPGWWASYPNLHVPTGWAEADPPYILHQFTSSYLWAGLERPADASWRNPAVPREALMTTPPPRVGVDTGTRIGIHVIQPSQCMEVIRAVRDRGGLLAGVLAVEQAGVLMEVAREMPSALRLLRFYTPEHDGLDRIHEWLPADIEAKATTLLDYLRTRVARLDVLEFGAVQLYVILNEADPIGETGWYNYGLLCKRLCEEATQAGLRIVLPGWNNGTPEYREMVLFFASGLAEALVEGHHGLNIHEGVHPPDSTGPIALDITPLPGAPWPVEGAGSLALRYRYAVDHLRRVGRPVPDLYVGEFYGGAYGPEAQPGTLANFITYDKAVRRDPWVRTFHGFTMDPDEGWRHQDYNPLMASDAMLAYIAGERDTANPALPSPLPDVLPGGAMTQYIITVSDTLSTGDIRDRLGAVNVLDLRLIVPIQDPTPPPYYTTWPMGVLEPTRTLAAPGRVVDFFKRDGQPFVPYPLRDAAGNPRPITWPMQASEHVVVGGVHLLRVLDREGTDNDWYVRAADVTPG